MRIRRFTIAGGNETALVWNIAKEGRLKIANKLLKFNEQIGFIDQDTKKLVMMGEELCVNSAIAAAVSFGELGDFTASQNKKVSFSVNGMQVTVCMRLDYKTIEPNIVLLDGIGFIFDKVSTKRLKELAGNYNLPAFGSIRKKRNKIYPTVYVSQTNSVIEETACGSGSIATNIMFGIEDVIQPTGQIIKVQKNKEKFTICADVKELKYNED